MKVLVTGFEAFTAGSEVVSMTVSAGLSTEAISLLINCETSTVSLVFSSVETDFAFFMGIKNELNNN